MKSLADKVVLRKCIDQSFMFSKLEEKEKRTVVDAFEERQCKSQTTVITQGEEGAEMFLVEKGELECFITINGQEKMVKTYGENDVFGELCLLYNQPRAATIKAKDDSRLWALDRATFNNIVKESSRKRVEMYEDFLAKVDLLSEMES